MNHNIPTENKPLVVLHSGHFRSPFNSTVSFAIASLLFLMPFLNIKCNDAKLMSVSGAKLAVGFKIKPSDIMSSWTGNNFFRDMYADAQKKKGTTGETGTTTDKDQVIATNYFLLTAMILSILATIVSFIPFKHRWKCCYIAGWIGVTGFLITLIAVSMQLSQYSLNLGIVSISINLTLWFFLSFIALIVGSLFSHQHDKREWQERKAIEMEAYLAECGYDEQPSIFSQSQPVHSEL